MPPTTSTGSEVGSIHLRRDLLERYGARPVPRYTSYPPANHWGQALGETDARAALARSGARPLSLYVHVPFCRSLCYYCGCNMRVTRRADLVERYLQALELEVEAVAAALPRIPEVVQLHLGGGTPTHLHSDQLRRLIAVLQRRFPWSRGIEASIEIHPSVTTAEQMRTLAELGFNRVSMGVQDFDPAVQQRINRLQTFERTRDLVELSRALRFVSVNVDLMYGLPLQTPEGFERTLDLVEELHPDRVALFGYAHVPSMKKHQGLFKPEELPRPAERLACWSCRSTALDAGYVHIGLDHFALAATSCAAPAPRARSAATSWATPPAPTATSWPSDPRRSPRCAGTYLQNAREVHAWADLLENGHLRWSGGTS
jgi:oxygen-independent coproporphyrinogen-3 oxidase